jgi:hypothetical protein
LRHFFFFYPIEQSKRAAVTGKTEHAELNSSGACNLAEVS